MELVYLWVAEYKNIKRQGFNFSPRFDCEFKDGVLDICDKKKKECKDNDYLENFFGDNINITAIVGENGSGKSSLLNFIIEQNEHFGIFVFKHKNELLIFDKNLKNETFDIKSNYKYILNPTYLEKYGTSLLFLKSYMDINTYTVSDQLNILRRFFQFSEKRDFLSDLHKNTTELFNIVSINTKKHIDDTFQTSPYSTMALSQHFTYLKEKHLHKILKYYPDLENFIGQYFKVEKIEYKLKDLGSIFLASPKFKDNYKNDKFLSDMFNRFNGEESTENRLKILCLVFCYLDEEKINSFILEEQDSLSYIELYDLIKEQNYSYIVLWNDFIEAMKVKDDFKTIIKKYLIFVKEIRREILEFSFTPSLSSGEEKLLYLFINIYDYIIYMKKIRTIYFTIIIDEPDTLLHPNWQKKLIFLLVTFINTFFKDDIFNLILTSHSPFLLSDLSKENVIFLEKYTEKEIEENNLDQKVGNCKNSTKDIKMNPFAANIHTLLSNGFFMKDGLMGEFAKGKINEIIDFHKKVEPKDADIEALKIEYEDIRDKFWQTQSIIGEDYLKQVIKNHLIEIDKTLLGKEQAKDNEVARLRAEADKLESSES